MARAGGWRRRRLLRAGLEARRAPPPARPAGAHGHGGGTVGSRRPGPPPLTILGERRQRRQQQQQRREGQRGTHRVLAPGPEQVAARLAEGPSARVVRAWVPLPEAWRWLRRPGGDPCPRAALRRPSSRPLRQSWAGARSQRQRSGGRVRRGRCPRGCGPGSGCGDSVQSAPPPPPGARWRRQCRAGRAGRALGREQ